MGDERPAEDRLIEALFMRHGADGESVLAGPGDDAAVVRCPPGEDLVITTDTLNEGVHFPAGAPAHSVGHRALAVSLSDLASMGARPLWAVVTLSAPFAEEAWLRDFADGLFSLADRFGVRVVGGDFARGPLNVTVAAHGSAAGLAVLRRGGARAGDGIWVSGFLGDAAAGLTLLKPRLRQGGFPGGAGGAALQQCPAWPARNVDSLEETLIWQFCYPRPQVELGARLRGIASACMDLSDGLAVDLPRLLRASGLAAAVRLEQLPVSRQLKAFAGAGEAREIAFCGGDDYQLCFTAAASAERQLARISEEHSLTRIGETRDGEGLAVTSGGRPWQAAREGFSHFS